MLNNYSVNLVICLVIKLIQMHNTLQKIILYFIYKHIKYCYDKVNSYLYIFVVEYL